MMGYNSLAQPWGGGVRKRGGLGGEGGRTKSGAGP